MIKHILYAIAFLLLLPVNILVWLCWFLPEYKKGAFESIELDWDSWSLQWDVSENSDLFQKMSTGSWWGFVIVSNIVFIDYFPKRTKDKKHIKHEKRHVWQNYVLNIFFYPVYVLCSGYIWCFKWELHPYYDNPFEIDARRAAGQQLSIPIEDWKNGPHDRWPWW